MSKYIVHVEIPYTDREAMTKFYGGMFGWEHETDPTFDYTMFRANENAGGGYVKIGEYDTKPDRLLVYFDSDDIDADTQKIEGLGGKLVDPKMAIPGMGWMAKFTDPSGNLIALWQNDPNAA